MKELKSSDEIESGVDKKISEEKLWVT